MSLTLVGRFHPHLRREQQAMIDAGFMRKVDELELLEPAQLRPLALFSLQLLVVGGIFFCALNLLAYFWQMHTLSFNLSIWGVLWWLAWNVISYIIILPIHELIHGFMIVFWGGKPHFGAKLPFALYCGAKNQLFHRNHYLAVGLAPLVVITLAGIFLTLFVPIIAFYTLLATAGNISGAAGDLWMARVLWRTAPQKLVEDTETGYRIWELVAP